jgi:uncharacterized membrane protein YdjX (TVP38/TMEM64 family)
VSNNLAALAPPADGGRLRLIIGAGAGILILACIVASRFGFADAQNWMAQATGTLRNAGPLGLALFAVAQTIVSIVGVVPASLLGIAAGGVYGVAAGFLLAATGTICGGWIAFMLARSLMRPWITRRLQARTGGRLNDLDAKIARDGWRLVCLLRISPIMPFAFTSYALGLTQVSTRDYMIGTLASLPALLGYVAAGALASHGAHMVAVPAAAGGPLQWVLIAVGVLATGFLIFRSGALLKSCGFLP